ncbi:hypothetical protein MUP95_10390, partial [bacterium]|nr:hypothetical protein [bacterium]
YWNHIISINIGWVQAIGSQSLCTNKKKTKMINKILAITGILSIFAFSNAFAQLEAFKISVAVAEGFCVRLDWTIQVLF